MMSKSPIPPGATAELHAKARLLRASPFFRGTTDLYPMVEKQLILLVLAGLKPVSEVATSHLIPTRTGRETRSDDPREVGRFLAALGLSYQLTVTKHATIAAVALRPDLLAEYDRAKGHRSFGRLFGYPETAVEGVATDRSMESRDQEAILTRAGLPESFSPFILSVDHWREELDVAKSWFETLRAYGLTIDPARSEPDADPLAA